ncbi:MAG: prepilin peptidase, partial [Planctomycetota bacterium]
DNGPLISYLALRGKCRACQAPIAERYFIVEIIAALIVGSLFLYELVTGAANIPGFQHYHHAGILWIVLYTKWPVMGIYLYHVMMFCAVLTFALMEWDGLRAPTRLSFSVILTFAALAIAIPTLQPVSFDAYLPVTAPPVVPEMIWRGVTCLLGGLAGWAIAGAFRRLHSGREFAWSLVLLGVSLGWQATLTIALLWMVIRFLLKLTWTSRPRWLAATPLLFALAMLHHPFWRFFSQFWWRLAG